MQESARFTDDSDSPVPGGLEPTLHALELGSATGFTKGTIIPQKPPPDDNPALAGRCVLQPLNSTLLPLC